MKNLFIVGAQRSGSTYLYSMLDGHPQVSMVHPVRPEPKFFMSEQLVAKGKDHYLETYFRDRKGNALYLGEKSTSYIESPEAARRMRDYYPDARILMILRDPVVRAYSNYRFSVAHKLEPLTFEDALAAEPERLKSAEFTTSVTPFAYRQRGHYIDYIENYLKVFDASQLFVLIFEEFVGNLEQVHSLYRWLGIDDGYVPDTLREVLNPATVESEDQSEAFRSLALGCRDSIARLEVHLGRRIDVWRRHHLSICEGICA
jgi:hypothetical protein